MSDVAPPKHAYELTVQIGADDWPTVIREIERLAAHIEDHGPECSMSSGGYGVASSVNIVTRDVTPEQYRKELAEWMEKR